MAYETKNACSQTPSLLSIFTALLYLIQLVLHSVFAVPGIVEIDQPILWVLLGVHYVTLLFIVYDYIWIMVHDPVDRVVLDPKLAEQYQFHDLQDCAVCGKRLRGSHHCSQCGRCTEDFDHHCKFLNNCIGKHNYEEFIRLLSMNILYFTISIGQSIWVLVMAISNKSVAEAIPPTFWLLILLILISGILLILILILQAFHCYISCCLNMTTLDFIVNSPSDPTERKYQEPASSARGFK